MTAEDEELRALEYRAALRRRERARKLRLAALGGDPAAARKVREDYKPLTRLGEDERRVMGDGPAK